MPRAFRLRRSVHAKRAPEPNEVFAFTEGRGVTLVVRPRVATAVTEGRPGPTPCAAKPVEPLPDAVIGIACGSIRGLKR